MPSSSRSPPPAWRAQPAPNPMRRPQHRPALPPAPCPRAHRGSPSPARSARRSPESPAQRASPARWRAPCRIRTRSDTARPARGRSSAPRRSAGQTLQAPAQTAPSSAMPPRRRRPAPARSCTQAMRPAHTYAGTAAKSFFSSFSTHPCIFSESCYHIRRISRAKPIS